MTTDQLTEQLIKYGGEIAALQENVKSAHKRIDENDRIIDGIHKLAANVESLALQVKLLTEKMESSISRVENGLKSQGERIGALEKEPAAKWKNFTWLIITGISTAILTFIMSKIL